MEIPPARNLGISGVVVLPTPIPKNNGRSSSKSHPDFSQRNKKYWFQDCSIAAMAYNFGSIMFAMIAISNISVDLGVGLGGDRITLMVAAKLTNAQNDPGAADWFFDGVLAYIVSRSSELSIDATGPRWRTA
ncbi:hypothetical protein B0H16DRAFT_1471728 [Mycena metata]|uniref:Uncharacterized protein n=1 Tax=Mycena metata TaxID=1033252 RepID=A0AAD7MPT3_9AGAR|nr:hypothetical protein B0H16DRAFT_1471728 [Mycena metata]